MSTASRTVEPETDDLTDLLPEALASKGPAVPLKRTKRQEAALAKKAQKDALEAQAARLAQIVNLHIAGYSLADIGAAIGASEAEVDRMLTQDMARYVRSQPALRTYIRNYISGKYTALLEAVWDEATDKTHGEKLEHQDRALRILDRMAKLHGAEAPSQAEIKMDAAPEVVDRLVQAIAANQGLGYDATIFDVVDAEVVHEAAGHDALALEAAAHEMDEESQ